MVATIIKEMMVSQPCLRFYEKHLQAMSKIPCSPEGAFFATEWSFNPKVEILRFAQDDIFEMGCSKNSRGKFFIC